MPADPSADGTNTAADTDQCPAPACQQPAARCHTAGRPIPVHRQPDLDPLAVVPLRLLPEHMAALATHVGLRIDADEITPVTAYDPHTVIACVTTAAEHAGLRYALHLLDTAIAQLQQFIADDDPPYDQHDLAVLAHLTPIREHQATRLRQRLRQHERYLNALMPLGLIGTTNPSDAPDREEPR